VLAEWFFHKIATAIVARHAGHSRSGSADEPHAGTLRRAIWRRFPPQPLVRHTTQRPFLPQLERDATARRAQRNAAERHGLRIEYDLISGAAFPPHGLNNGSLTVRADERRSKRRPVTLALAKGTARVVHDTRQRQ